MKNKLSCRNVLQTNRKGLQRSSGSRQRATVSGQSRNAQDKEEMHMLKKGKVMQEIKVIIGASYGDEGKGLATDFFGAQAESRHPAHLTSDMVNVLTNGGPQRGHTVELADGRRHVFKHFGSAFFRGAVSYFDRAFMVNPMEFMREYDALRTVQAAPRAYMHPDCRFTTPWDMLVNQLLQEKRGIHNSCGFGIWETVLRYQRGCGVPFSTFAAMNRDDRIALLRRIRDGYFISRIKEIENMHFSQDTVKEDTELPEFFFSEDLLFHFEEDCESMRHLCPIRTEDFMQNYQTVLFENAQGLLLDGNSKDDAEYTTPSTTGVGRVFQTVENVFEGADVEVCYVSRSYLTRHGDGKMEHEIAPCELKKQLPGVRKDLTNIENCFQGRLRYGMMDTDSLTGRILSDFAACGSTAKNLYRPSLMITHLNEYAGIDTDALAGPFGSLYLSDGRTSADITAFCGRGA